MSLIQRLLQSLGLVSQPGSRLFELDEHLHASLEELAAQQQVSMEELAGDLLQQALYERQTAEANLQRWRELSPRQQEIAALICLGYTNRQIAARLVLSPETVKTHVHHLLQRFGAGSKAELRQRLVNWDFSAWE